MAAIFKTSGVAFAYCALLVLSACSRHEDKRPSAMAQANKAPSDVEIPGKTPERADGDSAKPSGIPTTGSNADAPAATKTYSQLVNDATAVALQGDYRHLSTGVRDLGSGGFSFGSSPTWCAPAVKCQDRYAQISIVSPSGSQFECSGVVLAKDLVLTNRHCAEIVSPEANQSFGMASIAVTSPGAEQGGGPGSSFGNVENVVAIAPPNLRKGPTGTADWAILKMKAYAPFTSTAADGRGRRSKSQRN